MQVAVPGALAQIVDLAARATSEQVRLQAAKDIMDRAGLKPTERIEQVTIEKSTDALDFFLEKSAAHISKCVARTSNKYEQPFVFLAFRGIARFRFEGASDKPSIQKRSEIVFVKLNYKYEIAKYEITKYQITEYGITNSI